MEEYMEREFEIGIDIEENYSNECNHNARCKYPVE